MKLFCGDTFLFRGVKHKRGSHELLSLNSAEPQTRGQILEMAEEAQSETSAQTAESDTETGTVEQASLTVIEIHDSTTECEEDVRPRVVQMEEKAFISSLHSFMKGKGTPIERIPHLGFKQINLWRIYKAVDKLGGYDSVTARRLWKKVYDELGGSPGSTSAATCTRRHYERLVLPFERHLKGEDNKPLPPSKPRKPYKRISDSKINKIEGKKKKTHSVREPNSEGLNHRSTEAVCQSEAVIHRHAALWASSSDRLLSDCSQPHAAGTDLVYAHVLQAPTSRSWFRHIPSAAGEVISPLEKKKRMAQASLNLPQSSHSVDKERPSIISCSQSPSRGSSSQNCSYSDGSPFPLSSSSSSRSPSPLSVSSDDSAAKSEDKPASNSEMPQNSTSTGQNTPGEESKPVSRSQTSEEPTGQNNNRTQVRSRPRIAETGKNLNHDSAWRPYHNGTSKYFPFTSPSSLSSSTTTSSFTKVVPKSVQLVRPSPVRANYKISPSRQPQQDGSLTSTKKLNNGTMWPYQTEKREKSRTMQQRVPPQQSLFHSTSTLPASSVFPSYSKAGRDSWDQPHLQPAFLSNRMRLPQSSLIYRHMAPALFGSAVYPYPYAIPFVYPQTRYTLPSVNPIYHHKL